MYQDVIDLRSFYQSPLGQITARLIRRQIYNLWPDVMGMSLLGLGYATPFMGKLRLEASTTIAVMPAQQGVMRWPHYSAHNAKNEFDRYHGNLTCLSHENYLPLKEGAIDRIIVSHCLEHTEKSRRVLREIWRALSPGGRVIVIVPNRTSPWTKSDRTPFGHGKPFSKRQIKKLLNDNMLTPINWRNALSLPPFKSRSLMSLMTPLEATGVNWWGNFSGALIIEAEKQIYARGTPKGSKIKIKKTAILHPQNGSMPRHRKHKRPE